METAVIVDDARKEQLARIVGAGSTPRKIMSSCKVVIDFKKPSTPERTNLIKEILSFT